MRSNLLEALLQGCADDGFDDGIRIKTELEPQSGPGGLVKPAVYEGGTYQQDRRWAAPDDSEPTRVIVIDNVPSQANRLEEALRRRNRESALVPEWVLDLSGLENLPAHLPRQLSSLEFPHRNADAYLRDAQLGDSDFIGTELGESIFGATAQTCGPLMAWFPQALLYGFWQSHLGKKRQNTKDARAWVSEIVGWNPAATDTRILGLKGDPLNLNTDESITSNPDSRVNWEIGAAGTVAGGKKDKLSEIGHGQVPFMGNEATAAAVSFARITQSALVSFAQLRRISLGPNLGEARRARAVRPPARLRPGFRLALRGRAPAPGDDGDVAGKPRRHVRDRGRRGGRPAVGRRHRARQIGGCAPRRLGSAADEAHPEKNLRTAIRASWPDLDA